MENRLFEAACTGNVGALSQLLQENPLILADFALTSPYESPLHVATKAKQLDFVREIIRHKPELAREVNQDGFRPMDIASAFGYADIVRVLLANSPEICRLPGRDRRTALHYAAMNGRVEAIDELLSVCPESMKDVTILGETALHLAVKYYKSEAFRCLVQWLQRLGMEEVVNWSDKEGNTVLHLAVCKKQLECVELLLDSSNTVGGSLELNVINHRGLTAMDVLDIVTESPSDVQLRDILRRAGARGAQDINNNNNGTSLGPHRLQQITTTNQNRQELLSVPSKDWFKYFKFQTERDSPSDARNALLVVAALIATVTFQAGVNPPSGFLEEKPQQNSGPPPRNQPPPPPQYSPVLTYGLASLIGNVAYAATSTWFVFGNTLGLTSSLSIIIYLTSGFPFQRELQIAIYSMIFAYCWSVDTIMPDNATKYIVLGIAFFLPFALRWLPRWAKKVWKWWRKPSTRRSAPLTSYWRLAARHNV